MKTLDPKQYNLIIDGAIISGFSDGTFITVARDEDSSFYSPSSTGGGTRVKNANKAGKVTFVLQQSSESNQILSDLINRDENGENVIVSVLMRDASGADKHKSEQCYVVKPADGTYGKETENRTWILQCEELLMNLGGN